jgi:peptidyl-tRNA hydrolase, PTH1 family
VKVVVGLGNPGSQYAGTRHNVGWLVLDRVAERAGWGGRGRQRDSSNVAMGRFNGLDLTLVKPLTWMNDSGTAVRKVLAREHAPLGDLLVIADDFALPFGKLRFREAGSHGGHNGLRSIIEEMGTEKFSRLRVGIGDPVRNGRDHVLSRFEPDEAERLDELLDAAAEAVEAWARDGTSRAANRFNTFQLREADMRRVAPAGEIDGPPNENGIRRTKTGWRRVLPFADRDRSQSGDKDRDPDA